MKRFIWGMFALFLILGFTGCKKNSTGTSQSEAYGFEAAFIGETIPPPTINRYIYLYNSNTNIFKPLTPDTAVISDYAWAADGSKIFYFGEYGEIYSVDMNGNVTRITGNSRGFRNLIASPDGRYLIYSGHSDGILKLDLETAAEEEILIPGFDVAYFQMSPGGDKIMVKSNSSPTQVIAAINADGSGFDTLTTATYPEFLLMNNWSPDATQIAYTRKYLTEPFYRVIVLDVQTKQELFRVDGHSARWSPDGRYICYMKDEGNRSHPWVMKANGAEAQKFSLPYLNISRVVWLPDSRRLFYVEDPLYARNAILISIDISNAEISELYTIEHFGPIGYNFKLAVRPSR